MSAIAKLLKDLLYGGRNEYLDVIRVEVFLGGIVFLALTVCEFAGLGTFDKLVFAGAFATLIGASAAAIAGRNWTDRAHGAVSSIGSGGE